MPEHAERASRSLSANRPQPRRGLSQSEAAVYIGVGLTKFLELVLQGRMPKPKLIGERKVWDVQQLDSAFEALPQEGEGGSWADIHNGSQGKKLSTTAH